MEQCLPQEGATPERAISGSEDLERQLLFSMSFHCGSGIAKSWGATRRVEQCLPQEGATPERVLSTSLSSQASASRIALVFQPVGVILASRAFRFNDSDLIQ
ncbi:MAG: hypothetical protein ABS69_05290 [Nitrosomonadales bacterium SCN 54-20]|nr:MAG: hypothetical protein ABS69_05290 [Nitrosomonadales bacterium SCN 54-20]